MSDHYDRYNGMEELLGPNLASLGTDCISRQQAIDALNEYMVGKRCDTDGTMMARLINELVIKQLPPIQSEIIRCRECKFASGDSRICMKFGHSPIGELDFCAWAERRTDG